ncbi:MAG: IS1380 family transposase [Deltaproteobacteria bacterium]|nr:IS1380 family transposase [Deltaproteobacteria bacterium]
MKTIIRKRLKKAKRRIGRRLRPIAWEEQAKPMFAAKNIQYEIAERTRAVAAGGIGAMHLVAQRSGLVELINQNVRVLKRHIPYHESDHVLNIAYNVLCGGSRLEHIEHRRNDEAYLDALGAQRIPDPTTEGDFCRRFESPEQVELLMEAINEARLNIWKQQPESFFEEAVIDADGTIAETTGQCKQGMDISYKGEWGYHPLVVSLANTGEPLYLSNRPGNRPSSEGAADYLDRSVALCRRAGFKKCRLRGDTDFSQTTYLDGWDADGVQFVFGIPAMKNLIAIAEDLENTAFSPLHRPAKYDVKTKPRQRLENVKERIVREREYENIRLESEEVAEFDYRPTKCRTSYRVVALKKNLSVERGERRLFDDIRWFFYITNDRTKSAAEIVRDANRRCNQENLIAQLKGGAKAMAMPVDTLVSNWAYMVMASLVWTLKAWSALLLPENGRWAKKHREEKRTLLRMEFATFVQAMIQMPAAIIHSGRKIVYRLLSWNPWQHIFFRLLDQLSKPLRC